MPQMKRSMLKRGAVGSDEAYRTYLIRLLSGNVSSGNLYWIHKDGVTISHAKTLKEAKKTIDMVID
jgi:hypothetical protein